MRTVLIVHGSCALAAVVEGDVAQVEDTSHEVEDLLLLLGSHAHHVHGVPGVGELLDVVDTVNGEASALAQVVEVLRRVELHLLCR